jgi:predicted MFS family arabinose efflux permease
MLKPSPDAIRFTITGITFGIGSGMIVPYFNVYFIKVMGAGVLEVGLASAIAGAVMIAGLFITPYVASRIGKIRSAVYTKILAAPCLVLMAFSGDFFIAAAAYVGYMFFINMAGPATTSFQMERLPRNEQGMALGLISTGSYLAISTSTYLGGWLIARGDYITPFLATCGAYLITAALLYHYFSKAETVAVPIRKCGVLLRTFIADLCNGRMEA